MILPGREVLAAEAHAIGLVDRLVDDGTALDHAVELAAGIAASPWGCVVSDRLCVYEGLGLPLEQGLANEDRRGREVIFADGFADGVARFTEGRR
jgi:enoyl-CoA hydratase